MNENNHLFANKYLHLIFAFFCYRYNHFFFLFKEKDDESGQFFVISVHVQIFNLIKKSITHNNFLLIFIKKMFSCLLFILLFFDIHYSMARKNMILIHLNLNRLYYYLSKSRERKKKE